MSQNEPLSCSHRAPDDDFFCEKFGVWYPLADCNYRVLNRTYEGCVRCFQGRVNLRSPRVPLARGGEVAANVLRFPASDEERAVPATAPRKG
ncbi:MAG: hypothetical protein PVF68_09490 [Acidobacteriota bacterium]|jgi:hypothetical protein